MAPPRRIRRVAHHGRRLEALDQQRQSWGQRLERYRSAKAAIEANQGMSASDQRAAIAQLAADNFDERERLRLDAALQLAQSKQKP